MDGNTQPNHLIHSFQHTANSEGNMWGLTKREHFAAMAMQGYVSELTDGVSKEALAEWSVGMADALIEALNKEAL